MLKEITSLVLAVTRNAPYSGIGKKVVMNLEDKSDNRLLRDYEPDARKEEILKILRQLKDALYEILEVDEEASVGQIKNAYYGKSKLTYIDYNDDV